MCIRDRSYIVGGPYKSIASVGPDVTSYTDTEVMNGSTYYYVVTAVYDIGESDPSNEASATPMNTVILTLSDAAVVSGENVQVDFGLTNVENIASMQFDLIDVPDFLEISSISVSDAVPSDWTVDFSEQANGSARITSSSSDGTFNVYLAADGSVQGGPVTFEIGCALSVSDNEISDLRIYPNPVDSDYVTIVSSLTGDKFIEMFDICLLYTSPSPRDRG